MNDKDIVEMYWERDETAIKMSQEKYGSYCRSIAVNILSSPEDSEECVNDTWLRAWNAIPPQKPGKLSLFLGKITRNLAIDRFRQNKSLKNNGGEIALCLEELEECVSKGSFIEEGVVLKDLINRFLRELPEKNRRIFMYRYWYMMPVGEISEKTAASVGTVKMTLKRIRDKLKKYLEKEGVNI
jgi:RNA polymerase sigma-70 factor (ECF subfamily)